MLFARHQYPYCWFRRYGNRSTAIAIVITKICQYVAGKGVIDMKIKIYDPALCCSSGLCGPSIDPVLVKVNDAVLTLKKQGVEVERFNLAQQPKDFMASKKVAGLLHKNGKKILPVIIVNEEIFKTGEYPSYEDLCEALGIEPLKTGRPITLQMGQ